MKFTPEIDAIIDQALAIADQPLQELKFDPADLDFDFGPVSFDFDPNGTPPAARPVSATASASPLVGTVKISLRIPSRILASFKARAAATGRPYQRLLNQVLRDAVRGRETPVGT